MFSDSDSSEIPVLVNAAGEIYILYIRNLQVVGLGTAHVFFLAQSFMIRDKEILYVAPAPADDFRKFIGFIVAPILKIGNATRDLNE